MRKILTVIVAIIAVSALSAKAADGKALYEKDCAKCHGADGKGETKMGKKYGCKDYTDAKVQAELKDEAATKAIKEGYKDKEGKVVMKPAEGLSDDDDQGPRRLHADLQEVTSRTSERDPAIPRESVAGRRVRQLSLRHHALSGHAAEGRAPGSRPPDTRQPD